MGKNSTRKKTFYFTILRELENSNNLSKIREKLSISKQNLNYYLRKLKSEGLIINKSEGLWEVVNTGKNSTKYGNFLPKDTIRGHAYVISIKINKFPENWNKRIDILKKKGINFKLVGAKETTPRIKCLGRKVWLCNNHIRIFDRKDESYYGLNAVESRKQAFWVFYKILNVLENKLGFKLRPFDIEWRKEHYALIKNDLAIDQNQKGIIWRVSDSEGEWLLIDDSLEKGGELENVGKKSLETNIPMQKWWNENKETKFQVTPKFILKGMNDMLEIQKMHSQNIVKHQKVLDEMLITLKAIQNSLTKT